MELDDLKKTWNTLDKQLQNKELVSDAELMQVMNQKRSDVIGTMNAMIRSSKSMLLTTFLLVGLIIFIRLYDGIFLSEPYFWTLVALLPPALAWSIYTMRYLINTKIEEMPLATVIERVNKYNYWMVLERIVGTLILFIFVLILVITIELWKRSLMDQILIPTIWILAFVFYFWFLNKYTFKRLQNIRRNLDELKELKLEN